MIAQPMPTNFTALDLLAWHEEGSLELSPKFQRRGVWKPAAKGFFLDTLLRGYPVPPLHIRMMPTAGSNRARREVIDGQQRLRTLLTSSRESSELVSSPFNLGRQDDRRYHRRRARDPEIDTVPRLSIPGNR